ncbi:MAG TPA: hypothetical protein DCZ94_09205 [Lentisphaeria bacterium]|nr:MAG: hypothetical protein A2X48_18440 [Lentisphaerae bacterium GWF2_49_21]HBC87117.1 hypothetical protein [Lentisphaeria bacterium]
MKSITVRNIPDEVLETAKMLSIKERRSLNNEILILLEKGLDRSAYPANQLSRQSRVKESFAMYRDKKLLKSLSNDKKMEREF